MGLNVAFKVIALAYRATLRNTCLWLPVLVRIYVGVLVLVHLDTMPFNMDTPLRHIILTPTPVLVLTP